MLVRHVGKFSKVSYEQFKKDVEKTYGEDTLSEQLIQGYYDAIKLPKRATSGSAGYDFFCPLDIDIPVGYCMTIPTGIKCNMEPTCFLAMFPRSGHGFKYGVHLANTVGIIDSDYAYSDNEGHIFVKMINDSTIAEPLLLDAGDAFCQGILIPFGLTADDDASGTRNGGFGSTDTK